MSGCTASPTWTVPQELPPAVYQERPPRCHGGGYKVTKCTGVQALHVNTTCSECMIRNLSLGVIEIHGYVKKLFHINYRNANTDITSDMTEVALKMLNTEVPSCSLQTGDHKIKIHAYIVSTDNPGPL